MRSKHTFALILVLIEIAYAFSRARSERRIWVRRGDQQMFCKLSISIESTNICWYMLGMVLNICWLGCSSLTNPTTIVARCGFRHFIAYSICTILPRLCVFAFKSSTHESLPMQADCVMQLSLDVYLNKIV